MIDAAAGVLLGDRPPALVRGTRDLARDLLAIAGVPARREPGYDFEVTRVCGQLATWVLYAAIGFVIVTDPGVDWPVWLFWIGVALALVAAETVSRRRRGVAA